MVSQYVYNLCHGKGTVSSELAKSPTDTPSAVTQRLYRSNKVPRDMPDSDDCKLDSSVDVLETASNCGRWPRNIEPSDLFLKAFADVLTCLDQDPLSGMVSPPLMGSNGYVPLTIIAPLVDVMRHVANLIAAAKKEVFFITCVWTPSVSQKLIKEALIVLSQNAKLRGERVTVRLMFDKANAWHTLDSHQIIKPAIYASEHIQLPLPEEIPYVDMKVINLHSIPLGTLHSKICVIDGESAAVMSNNVEDNANLEMLTHLNGHIVEGIRDTALITWNKALNEQPPVDDTHQTTELPHIRVEPQPKLTSPGEESFYDLIVDEETRTNATYEATPNETRLQATNRQLNLAIATPIPPTGPEISEGDEIIPYIRTITPNPIPMALVSRPPYGPCDSSSIHVPQNEAWVSLVRNAQRSVFIQTPDLNVDVLLQAIREALKRGVEVTYYICFGYNDAGEMIPGQGGTNEQAAQRLLASLPLESPESDLLYIHAYVAKDQDHPIHHSFRSRSCHVKLLIVDDTVGIQGSGNQDTQSWYHSQEVNVMIDSAAVCSAWRNAIDQNQNTRIFGKVAPDGVWRDEMGMAGKGFSGDPGVVGGLVKGVTGMFKKLMH